MIYVWLNKVMIRLLLYVFNVVLLMIMYDYIKLWLGDYYTFLIYFMLEYGNDYVRLLKVLIKRL